VRHAVEVGGQVRAHHVLVPGVQQRVDSPHGVQRVAPFPVGVLFQWQVGLEDRLQDEHRRRLHHAIPDRRELRTTPACTKPRGGASAPRASVWRG
jgi:hypothetical protein